MCFWLSTCVCVSRKPVCKIALISPQNYTITGERRHSAQRPRRLVASLSSPPLLESSRHSLPHLSYSLSYLLALFHQNMSYHREWDRGKDWEGSDHRGVSRGRDEEEGYIYGDGKRRKHTYGVRKQWEKIIETPLLINTLFAGLRLPRLLI